MLDFAAYLQRVGLSADERQTLQAIHRAHATSIPFENLDPHRGMPVSLAQEDLISFGPNGAHEQSGWSFRVIEEGAERFALPGFTLGADGRVR